MDDSTQKILQHARMAEQGLVARDPMREAIGLELDMINILYVYSCFLFIYLVVDVVPQYPPCANPCDAARKEEVTSFSRRCMYQLLSFVYFVSIN